MLVNELFYSAQGEGIHQGIPTVFVRLQGCNLYPETPCRWCDTGYALDEGYGRFMSTQEILDAIVKAQPRTYRSWVCLTGGEPLFQEDGLHELVKGLNKYGFCTEVFTNATLPRPTWWTKVDSWVADIKCPSSGVVGQLEVDWLDGRVSDQTKLTVLDTDDLDFAESIIKKAATKNSTVVVSPVITMGSRLSPEEGGIPRPWLQEVVRFCLEHQVFFSLQWHKVVWGNRKGV